MKRLTLFFGHYGSGKTNVAVNYALHLKKSNERVAIADIDIVNPYFRTKDSENELTAAGIRVISLPFANTNVDLPALPPEVYGIVQDKTTLAVMDIGGDDRGAFALGRYTPYILEENDYDALFVVNFYRPLTQNANDALEVMREIEDACKIKMTGIVNNSNIGEQTLSEDIIKTDTEAQRLSQIAGIPVVFTCAEESISHSSQFEFFPLVLQKKLF
jgi:nitrogenase subunit NifH